MSEPDARKTFGYPPTDYSFTGRYMYDVQGRFSRMANRNKKKIRVPEYQNAFCHKLYDMTQFEFYDWTLEEYDECYPPSRAEGLIMKALTLWEPWATLVADGYKQHETRSWATPYRGLLAIHAAKRWQHDQKDVVLGLAGVFPILEQYLDYDFPLGCVVAICRIVQVAPVLYYKYLVNFSDLDYALGNYQDGRFAWKLELVERFDTPIPAKGSQGLWEWNRDVPAVANVKDIPAEPVSKQLKLF